MEGFIKSRTKAIKLVDLVNGLSDKSEIDLYREAESFRTIQEEKRNIDSKIAVSIKEDGTFSEQCSDDSLYFEYEIETGVTNDGLLERKITIPELEPYVEKSIRITSYYGFDSECVIVPKENNSYSVVSMEVNYE